MKYWFRVGNTEISVEDLLKSRGLLPNGKYPGICQHCAKTGIRYLATVRQDVADTLARALGNTTRQGAALKRTDEELDALTVAQLGDKEYKQIEVGCVCVAKYLADCGIDAALAQSIQKRVNTITHILQEIASLEADKAPAYTATLIENFALVLKLQNRAQTFYIAYNDLNQLGQEKTNAYYALRNKVRMEYDAAGERWRREAHGFYAYAKAPTAADLVAYFDRKIKDNERKLNHYQRGAQYV